MDEIAAKLEHLLGLGAPPSDLDVYQLCARATFMFVVALVMLRLAHKRFFARRNAMDVLLTFVLASTLSRAINGSAPFFPTIAAGFSMVFLHRLVSWFAARSETFARIVKGSATELVVGGVVQERALRRHDLGREDLEEDLRINGVARPIDANRAILERNGEISVEKR